MTVIEMVKAKLREMGADGLCRGGYEGCGCSVDDLAQCGEMVSDCRAAMLDKAEAEANGCDEWYVPMVKP